MFKAALLTGLLIFSAGLARADCVEQPGPCKIELGEYHILLPEGTTGKIPAVMFLHGHGGDGAGVYNNAGMTKAILSRGYALIAPSGRDRDGNNGGSWSFHPERPERRDETAFLRSVLDDAAARYGIDRDRVLLSGFSIGGSMVSYAACEDPGLAAAYAPVSGSFWRPHPTECSGTVRLLHTHGWTDTTVPLEGRFLGGNGGTTGQIAQGDVFHAMEIWRATNGCTEMRADAFSTEGTFWHRRWDRCTPGSALEFVLFPGAHGVPKGWAEMALDWFEGL
jgi:polyhydroxybutyrate depolymerase